MHSAVQSSIVGRAPLILLLLLICISPAILQAPGDSDEQCINHPFHPGYEERENPLMDSKNYPLLLSTTQTSGVWQSLDLDDNNDEQQETKWTQGGLTCVNRLYVCGYGQGPQENWIITQHISRQVELDATIVTLQSVRVMLDVYFSPDCATNPSCINALSLYVWETSAPDSTSATDTSNYHFTADVTTNSQELTLNFSSQHSGFYLGIRDNGTCLGGMDVRGLIRVLVSYKSCSSRTLGLVRVAEGVTGVESVPGECVANSSAVQGDRALLSCSDSGNWSVINGCECDPGYWLSEETEKCVECPAGTYSDSVSNSPCQSCPGNSEGTQAGLSECPCVQNYYRAPDEGAGEACTRPPSAPRNVSVLDVANTSAVLSWLPPEDDGGRDRSEIHYTVTATGTGASMSVEVTVDVTMAEVTGLTPFTDYIFSVTSENAVSSLATDISSRTSTATGTTLQGVAGTVTDIKASDGSTVSWSPPNPPNGIIMYYNIKIIHWNSGELEQLIEVFNDTSIDVSGYVDSCGGYNVQVQAVTIVGCGSFSPSVAVTVGENEESDSSVVIGLAVTIVALVILLTTVAGLLSAYIITLRIRLRKENIKEDPTYEIPDDTAAPLPPLRTQKNVSYGVSPQ